MTKNSALKFIKSVLLAQPDKQPGCRFLNTREVILKNPVHVEFRSYARGRRGQEDCSVLNEYDIDKLYWFELHNDFQAVESGCSPHTISVMPAEVIIRLAEALLAEGYGEN